MPTPLSRSFSRIRVRSCWAGRTGTSGSSGTGPGERRSSSRSCGTATSAASGSRCESGTTAPSSRGRRQLLSRGRPEGGPVQHSRRPGASGFERGATLRDRGVRFSRGAATRPGRPAGGPVASPGDHGPRASSHPAGPPRSSISATPRGRAGAGALRGHRRSGGPRRRPARRRARGPGLGDRAGRASQRGEPSPGALWSGRSSGGASSWASLGALSDPDGCFSVIEGRASRPSSQPGRRGDRQFTALRRDRNASRWWTS